MRNNKLFSYGSFFVNCIVITYLLSSIFMWLNIGINPWIFPFSLIISSVAEIKTANWNYKDIFIICTITILLILLSQNIYDYSYDGQWYHSGTILKLSEGWNPIYQHDIKVHQSADLWINHYSRGMETVSACIVSTFNNLETGKSINLFFLASTIFYTLFFLNNILSETKTVIKLWLALIIVLNPVVVCQLFTYYIDYSLYSLILILTVLLYSINDKTNYRTLISICLILFFVPSIKFNIMFWIAMFMVGYTIYIWLRNKRLPKYIYAFILCGFLGVVIGAYNPYITNIIYHNNPFYPLMGNNSVDIMSIQLPPIYKDGNIITNILYSLIGNPENSLETTDFSVLNFTIENIKTSGYPDTRIGGFGIFFFESTIILIALFYFAKGENKKVVLLSLFILVISLFILPSGWWARYVVYFYLFPIVILIYLFKNKNNKFINNMRYIPLSLLSLNIITSLAMVTVTGIINRIKVNNTIEVISQLDNIEISTNNISFLNKLENHKIKYVNLDIMPQNSSRLRITGPEILVDLDKYGLTYKKMYKIEILSKKEKQS